MFAVSGTRRPRTAADDRRVPMIRTTRWALIAGLAVLAPACAERDPEPEVGAETTDSAPETRVTEADLAVWDVRFDDETGAAGAFQMAESEGGWTITTGASGSGITWRPADLMESGPFTVSAGMEEREAPLYHEEAYGLFVGGQHLKDPDQKYTYFLVRGSGHYLIKRRDGAETPTLVDWTASEAVPKVATAGGSAMNALEIRVQPDVTRFFINGVEVEALPTETVQPYGLAGLRVNHMLNVAVRDFRAERGDAAPTAEAGRTYPTGLAPETA
jgi:hypothetical protein